MKINQQNYDVRLALAPSARTTLTFSSTIIVPEEAKGVMWWLDITATSGLGGLKVQLGHIEPVTGSSVGGYIFHNNVAAVGLTIGVAAPGCIDLLSNNAFATYPLYINGKIRFQVQHATADSHTYSLRYKFIP